MLTDLILVAFLMVTGAIGGAFCGYWWGRLHQLKQSDNSYMDIIAELHVYYEKKIERIKQVDMDEGDWWKDGKK